MKLLKPILLFAGLVFLLACQPDRPYPEALLQAIRCMEQHSDSALIYLTSLDSVIRNEPEETRMYHGLLKTKAEYKEYIQHDSDSLMKEVVRFYESYGDADKLMEAYYYLSTVYQDMKNVPQGLAVCQQAADVGKDSRQYLTLGRIYQDIGLLLAYQSLYEDAMVAFQKSYGYFKMGEAPGQVYALRNIGRMHNELNQLDSAQYYYQAAYRKAYEINDSKRIKAISIELANVYLGWNKPDSTQKIFARIPEFKDDALYLQGLAHYHLLMSQPDSAEFYYLQALQAGRSNQNIYLKSSCNKALAELETRKGNYLPALNYALMSLELKDSIETITRTETIGKIHALYNYRHIEKENQQLLWENEHKQNQIYLLIISLLLIGGAASLYASHARRQKRLAQEQAKRLSVLKDEQYKNSRAYIEENEKKIAELEQLLHQTEGEKNFLQRELLQSQKNLLEFSNRKIKIGLDEKVYLVSVLKQSEIYQLFHQAAHQEDVLKSLTPESWDRLHTAIDATYNRFTEQLYSLCPKISEHELRICYLIKIQIPLKDIAKILCRSLSAISNSRVRLYKKISGEEGSPELLDKFIADL